jgi:hypothetical protein
MDGHHRHVAATEDGDPALSTVLKHRKLLGQRVDPVEGREI